MHAATCLRHRARRALGAVALAAAVTVGGSGCLFPNACPTIGYLSQVDVVLTGPQAAVADLVVMCSDLGCSTSAEAAVTAPPTEGPFWIATDLGKGHWRIDVSDSTPEEVTIEVLDAGGATLASTAEHLEWRRTADTGQCPGPVATDPITIDVG
ncbi:hypothetical protein [Agromyces cerinus]|uniref:Uncharacterized protein n=1 Tax=Agromyces cerinus subsp. cerinus TaxID=232089 RepID=A0A1N6DRL4_9MICO|nr:hypothetical protein [Agromyces cerinus]SIN73380.1 hypothetical protein SAMN05443544_0639 [Agromyces cerinus subsp. cerinus]